MQISLSDTNKKEQLVKALAKLAAADPTGKYLDLLSGIKGTKLPKSEEEMSVEDRVKIAGAQAKRDRKALKRNGK